MRNKGGFTLTEMLALLAIVALLAMTLAPALAKIRSNSKTIYCLNNLHGFTSGWLMYAGDNNDRVANNYGIPNIENTISSKRFDNWANNIMTWGAGTGLDDVSNTDVPKPPKTWLMVEEHPDSINDGYFLNAPQATSWGDVPASYHEGGCGFAFVDCAPDRFQLF